jgi:hypothetical protein
MNNTHRKCLAALSALIGLQTVMFASLITQTPPHPPLTIPLFAMGPFLGCSISIAVAAMLLGATASRTGVVTSTLAAALALISFGPQKWFDPAITEIWPAVLLGQIAAVAILGCAYHALRGERPSKLEPSRA